MDKQNFEKVYQNQLTPKQKEVIPFLLKGLSNQEIAQALDIIVPSTIAHRISSIRKKFEASDKKDLIYLFHKFKPELVSERARKQAGILEKATFPEIPYPECSEALDSPLYIQRENIDPKCQSLIDKKGCLIRIKAPKEMGKTSLINRLVDYAQQKDNYIVYYDFSFVDLSTLKNIHNFFYSLASFLVEEISDLTDKNFNLSAWNKENSLTMECTKLLKGILRKIDKPLVLIFDETDRIFPYEEIYQSFAPMLRYWHENGKKSPVWKKLKLVLSHSTEEYGKLDIDKSPFTNVGVTINLKDFTLSQVNELAIQHNLKDQIVVKSLIDLVGGHPYLIRLALYYLAQEKLSLNNLLSKAGTDSGIYKQHLQRHLDNLQKKPSLEATFRQIIKSNTPLLIKEQKVKHQLEGMGLISLQGNSADVRYQIYRLYFQEYLA